MQSSGTLMSRGMIISIVSHVSTRDRKSHTVVRLNTRVPFWICLGLAALSSSWFLLVFSTGTRKEVSGTHDSATPATWMTTDSPRKELKTSTTKTLSCILSDVSFFRRLITRMGLIYGRFRCFIHFFRCFWPVCLPPMTPKWNSRYMLRKEVPSFWFWHFKLLDLLTNHHLQLNLQPLDIINFQFYRGNFKTFPAWWSLPTTSLFTSSLFKVLWSASMAPAKL